MKQIRGMFELYYMLKKSQNETKKNERMKQCSKNTFILTLTFLKPHSFPYKIIALNKARVNF